MKVHFHKLSGSGNDFVIIDNLDGKYDSWDKSAAAQYLCRRRVSVGADGLIFLDKSDSADVKMTYINSDGSFADMCGNGARCTAFVFSKLYGKNSLKIQTGAGIIGAEVQDSYVRVAMPPGKLVQPDAEILVDGLPFMMDWYDTGVPHAVIVVDDVWDIPVEEWGREIRYHRRFQPAGTNVDFVEVMDEHTVKIRTYERGVESETLACGTGAVASALSAARKGLVSPPVKVLVALPDTLDINFTLNNGSADDITFAGNVIYSFEGEVEIPDEIVNP